MTDMDTRQGTNLLQMLQTVSAVALRNWENVIVLAVMNSVY